MKTVHDKYAEVLVNYSLKTKKGESVMIRGSYIAEPLIQSVYREVLKAGGHPFVMSDIRGLQKIYYDNATEEQLKYINPVVEFLTKNIDSTINIMAPFNLKSTQSVDPEKKKISAMASADIQRTFMQRAAEGKLKWTLCQFPCDSQAQESNMSLSEYEDFVYSACHLYADNPVQKWQDVHDFQQKIVDYLNGKKIIKYKSADVDITFSAEGRKWINSDGTHNMPSGEVFTTPVEDSINGRVRFSYPGIFMGNEIEDITLEVKDGEVVKWSAKKGQNLLDKVFEIPGARRFGEAAVGTNDGITKFTKNMLFDEKIGGTIHMAVGAAYPDTGGKNESSIHWDLLADMTDGGEIFADGELIYKNGKFII